MKSDRFPDSKFPIRYYKILMKFQLIYRSNINNSEAICISCIDLET